MCNGQSDCNVCNVALRFVQNSTFRTSSTTNQAALTAMFNEDYKHWEDIRKGDASGVNAGVGYDMFKANFGSSSSSQQSKEKYDAMRRSYQTSGQLSNSDYQFLFQQTTDPQLLGQWLTCILNNCGEGPFMKMSIQPEEEFTVNMGWNNKNAYYNDFKTSIIIVMQNCTLVSGNLKDNATFGPKYSLIGVFRKINKLQRASVSALVQGYADKFSVEIPGETIKPEVAAPIEVIYYPKDATVMGYMKFDSEQNAIISAQDGMIAREGGPENVSWDVSVPKSGNYRIEIMINNPYSTNLLVKVFKDINRNNRDLPVVSKAAFANFFVSSSKDYTFKNVPSTIELLADTRYQITFHAPFIYEENRDYVRLPYFKKMKLILVE